MSLDALQRKLEYQFQDLGLLELALTHKSHASENNERLEFLGDAILGYVIADELFRHHSHFNEDDMSLARAHLVRGTTLAEISREFELGQCLRMGSGERRSGGRDRDSILADALEAIVGAVHVDGGLQAARDVILKVYGERVMQANPDAWKDAKTQLQELLQGNGRALPVYEVESVEGADHDRRYVVSCTIDSGDSVVGRASSRRKAEKDAAQNMLIELGEADV